MPHPLHPLHPVHPLQLPVQVPLHPEQPPVQEPSQLPVQLPVQVSWQVPVQPVHRPAQLPEQEMVWLMMPWALFATALSSFAVSRSPSSTGVFSPVLILPNSSYIWLTSSARGSWASTVMALAWAWVISARLTISASTSSRISERWVLLISVPADTATLPASPHRILIQIRPSTWTGYSSLPQLSYSGTEHT